MLTSGTKRASSPRWDLGADGESWGLAAEPLLEKKPRNNESGGTTPAKYRLNEYSVFLMN